MYALVPRRGSGYSLHTAQPHGVSSVRLGCGRLVLRNGLRLSEQAPNPIPRGTHACPKCKEQQ